MSRLFRQDRLTAWNSIAATFAGWHDRAIATLVLAIASAAVRAWFADRPWTTEVGAALITGTLIGFWAGRLIVTRLAFHAFDGLLAADALQPRERRRYIAAWHVVGAISLAVAMLIARPSLPIVSVPAYLAGALLAGLTGRLTLSRRVAGARRSGWAIRGWSRRPIAGVSVAMVLLVSLLPARTLGTDALTAIVGIEAVLLALMLTDVDDAVVRFMTIAGHGSRRILDYHAKGLVSFAAVTVPGSWVMVGPVAAGVIAAACGAALLLLTLRILTYRLHPRRFADLVVSILAGLLMLVAYSMPVALPVIAPAILWQLQRRGRARAWLLA